MKDDRVDEIRQLLPQASVQPGLILGFLLRERRRCNFLWLRLSAKSGKFGEVSEPRDGSTPCAHPRGRLDEAVLECPKLGFRRNEIDQSCAAHFAFD